MSLVPSVPTENIIDVPARQNQQNFTWTGMLKPSWIRFFNQIRLIVVSIQNSGTTAQRPTANLWPGMFYFDTTLGRPIWIKADGATWIDATGTPV
jgi:hypothetical protein